jgi:hypothetical protein
VARAAMGEEEDNDEEDENGSIEGTGGAEDNNEGTRTPSP